MSRLQIKAARKILIDTIQRTYPAGATILVARKGRVWCEVIDQADDRVKVRNLTSLREYWIYYTDIESEGETV